MCQRTFVPCFVYACFVFWCFDGVVVWVERYSIQLPLLFRPQAHSVAVLVTYFVCWVLVWSRYGDKVDGGCVELERGQDAHWFDITLQRHSPGNR